MQSMETADVLALAYAIGEHVWMQARALRWGSHHPGECGRIPVDEECLSQEQRAFKDVLTVHWPDDNAPHVIVHLHSSRP